MVNQYGEEHCPLAPLQVESTNNIRTIWPLKLICKSTEPLTYVQMLCRLVTVARLHMVDDMVAEIGKWYLCSMSLVVTIIMDKYLVFKLC